MSDTAFTDGPLYDTAGPALRKVIEEHQSFAVGPHGIVPDDEGAIAYKVKAWADLKGEERVDWIIVAGGQCTLSFHINE